MKAESAQAQPEQARKTTPREYALRFVFGGIITAAVGIVGKAWGPAVAGLFLAFPAILPASMTLVEKHEDRKAAGRDAIGAAAGSVGLVAFAVVIWALGAHWLAAIVLVVALVVWLAVSIGTWWIAMRLRDWEQVG
jgi:hypothetical protein